MSTMVGADVAELRELAGTFDARAAMLRTLEAQLSWRIHSAPWDGGDVDRFQGDWNNHHRRVLVAAATSIADAAQVLRANADQQEQASAAGFVGQVASVPALRAAEQRRVQVCQAQGSGGPSWIDQALEKAAAAVTLTGAGIEGVTKWTVLAATEGVNLRSYPIAEQFIESSSKSLAALDGVGKFLGPIGIAFDVKDFIEDAGPNGGKGPDGWGMALSGASVAASTVAMVAAAGFGGAALVAAAPALAVGAAVVGVGSLIYHNRQAIGQFASDAGKGIASAATWAATKTVEIGKAYVDVQVQTATAVVDTAARVAGAVTDTATRAVDAVADTGRKFVEGILRTPAWAPW